VYSWGDATEGATGHESKQDEDGHILAPLLVEIKPAVKFLAVSCGLFHTIAMTGSFVSFSTNYPQPKKKNNRPLLSVVFAMTLNAFDIMLNVDDGCVWSWGRGDNGRLGHGNTDKLLAPKRIEAFDSVKNRALYISAGYHHSMVVNTRGSIYTWGSGWSGQLGSPLCYRSPSSFSK
jgi:alpha-tubulin suppressor-like RCC1 family protein